MIDWNFSAESARTIGQDILLAGAAIMAVFYGVRRIYRMAKNVDELVSNIKVDRQERENVAKVLEDHIAEETQRDLKNEEVIRALVAGQNEILREIRPNGGSSMKDTINQVQRDVAVLTQWKSDLQTMRPRN